MTQSMTQAPARPQPVPTAETRPFWAGAAEGALVLRRCGACGRLAPPLAPRCPECLGDSLQPETLSGRATLKGRTRLHLQPLPGRSGPLVIVEAALVEDPRIVLVALDESGCTAEAPPGTPLRLGFAAPDDGTRFLIVLSAEGQP
ncbi:hypothetical protein DDE23_08760 [Pararhodobacter aggregans]|uniref:ChsH2 rubredoxin-like zinc ribbon domain-containing protein n=2 Tax=Pararhodobacter aggregans TaxID=404875 RepID=A0A2T7UU04_9RHOB|nr:hypothetical protein C8N33_104364 [Pararhodobacter aggregans]PVE48207.1 hypothetical protein DDE23_08760 [Pararhodobacter aggregans]